MKKIIVDSNILFSAFLNLKSNIGQILVNRKKQFDFYAPKYAVTELLNHKEKIKRIARLNEESFYETYNLIFKQITVLNHSLLPDEVLIKAYIYCYDIDIDDIIFVAFSEYLNAELWTGDKKLIKGLKSKGFSRTVTTRGLQNISI